MINIREDLEGPNVSLKKTEFSIGFSTGSYTYGILNHLRRWIGGERPVLWTGEVRKLSQALGVGAQRHEAKVDVVKRARGCQNGRLAPADRQAGQDHGGPCSARFKIWDFAQKTLEAPAKFPGHRRRGCRLERTVPGGEPAAFPLRPAPDFYFG